MYKLCNKVLISITLFIQISPSSRSFQLLPLHCTLVPYDAIHFHVHTPRANCSSQAHNTPSPACVLYTWRVPCARKIGIPKAPSALSKPWVLYALRGGTIAWWAGIVELVELYLYRSSRALLRRRARARAATALLSGVRKLWVFPGRGVCRMSRRVCLNGV